jgi:hypothetical protein
MNREFHRPANQNAVRVAKFRRRILATYVLGGALFGYLVLHPASMVVDTWESSPPPGGIGSGLEEALDGVLEAFHPAMGLMGGFFVVVGAGMGLVAGAYARALCRRSALLARQQKALGLDLEAILRAGESETVEFKSTLRWDCGLGRVNRDLEHAVIKSIAGFMNGQGGTLVIGVDDQGNPLGIERDWSTLKRPDEDGFEQRIMRLVGDRIGCRYCPHLHVLFHTLASRRICRVYVDPAAEPAYVHSGNDTRFFLRAGNGTRQLDVEEAARYVSRRWGG